MYRHTKNTACVIEDEGGAAWLLPLSTSEIYQMPPSAYAIWIACDGAIDQDEVVQRLVERHDWETDLIGRPVRDFVSELINRGLLVEVTP